MSTKLSLLQKLIISFINDMKVIMEEVDEKTYKSIIEQNLQFINDNIGKVDDEFLVQQNLACTLHKWVELQQAEEKNIIPLLKTFMTVFDIKTSHPEVDKAINKIIDSDKITLEHKQKILKHLILSVKGTIVTLHNIRIPTKVNGKPTYKKQFLTEIKVTNWARLFNVKIPFPDQDNTQ